MDDTQIVIVGAGVMGLATARALSKRGGEVVVLEQFEVGHTRGSSHGQSRVFRFSYDDALYVQMAMESLPLWRQLEYESGRSLLRILGGLDFGGDLGPNIQALQSCGATFELMKARDVASRFPTVSLPEGAEALFQEDAGIVAADEAVRGFLDAATNRGVEVRERTRVLDIQPVEGGALIATEGQTYRANRVVVTVGAWVGPLLAGAGLDVPVVPTRETVAYFPHGDEMMVPILVERGSWFIYALPDPGHGIKVGAHHTGPKTDPNEEGIVSGEVVEVLAEWVSRHYPLASSHPDRAETCLYTNTEDEHFILERRGAMVIGSPCSGHGFKFAPLIGERLADLALG